MLLSSRLEKTKCTLRRLLSRRRASLMILVQILEVTCRAGLLKSSLCDDVPWRGGRLRGLVYNDEKRFFTTAGLQLLLAALLLQ